MLPPDARAVLLDQLRPPGGFTLDAAVATTFSLDLAAALIPPLAFAFFELRGTPDPVAALEAVRSCTDRVDLFCQAGQIAVPAQASDLMLFLEPMVHEVRRPRPGHLFHPKIWLLRYASPDTGDLFRLLCLTRNLTRDHAWDAVLRIDGAVSGGPKAGNRPLADLPRALPGLATIPLPVDRSERLLGLAEDVRRIEWELPEAVNEIYFHLYGIGAPPKADFSGYRHLVVSPFLNEAGLATVARDSPSAAIVSRVKDLDKLTPETSARFTQYVISGIAGLEEPVADDGLEAVQVLSGLHAKIYVVERNRLAHVFIGSANATQAAFGGNVEVLVEMVGGATKMGVDTFLGEDAPFRAMLEPYAGTGGAEPDPLDEARRALDDLLRDIAAVPHVVTVEPAVGQETGFTLTVTTERPRSIPDDYRVTVELLTRLGDAHAQTGGVVPALTFSDVPLPDITPFLVLRATSPEGLQAGTVIRGRLVNDPEGRFDEVLARQVDTTEKFLRFLALLLGLGNPFVLAALGGTGDGSTSSTGLGPRPGIFELVVRALAARPEAIADLDRLVQRLRATDAGQRVLPEGFDDLWATVAEAQHRLQVKVAG